MWLSSKQDNATHPVKHRGCLAQTLSVCRNARDWVCVRVREVVGLGGGEQRGRPRSHSFVFSPTASNIVKWPVTTPIWNCNNRLSAVPDFFRLLPFFAKPEIGSFWAWTSCCMCGAGSWCYTWSGDCWRQPISCITSAGTQRCWLPWGRHWDPVAESRWGSAGL